MRWNPGKFQTFTSIKGLESVLDFFHRSFFHQRPDPGVVAPVVFLLCFPAGNLPFPQEEEGGLGEIQYLEQIVVIYNYDESRTVPQGTDFSFQDILPHRRGDEGA